MSDFIHDPTGLRSGTPSRGSNTGRLGFVLVACLAIALLAFAGWNAWSPKAAAPTPAKAVAPDVPRQTLPEPVEQREPEPTPEEKAEEDLRDRQIVMEPLVRKDMCEEYGKRYLAARTGVQLVRSVQLSQAAGCDWSAMLHADAATHGFTPEALAVAQRMEAEEVPTAASIAGDDAETIDRLSSKIDDVERKVDEIRWRVR